MIAEGVYVADAIDRPVAAVPPGVYGIGACMKGYTLNRMSPPADHILDLPGCPSEGAVAGIERFWEHREKYERFGLTYKRGILAYGPPGTGKTILVRRLSDAIVERNGVVIFSGNVGAVAHMLPMLRKLQPQSPLAVVFEDIDAYCGNDDEDDDDGRGSEMTALLDGQIAVDNVVFIATTNHLSRLGKRFVNRPARFDELIEVGPPNAEARRTYLLYALATAGEAVEPETVEGWVAATEGMVVAHLREFVAAVLCLGQESATVIERLKKMNA